MALLHRHGRLKHSPGLTVQDAVLSLTNPHTSAAWIQEPLNPLLNYFEVEILEASGECAIGIGTGEMRYPLSRMPGWNRNSVGYHSDDGRLYHAKGHGTDYGPKCNVGDRMGCGVNFSSEGSGYVDVFFTKNGVLVGHPVRMKRPLFGLYPLIGLHSKGECVRYLGHMQRNHDSLCEPMIQGSSPTNHWLRCNGVRFLDDGLTIEYCGDTSQSQDVGIAQAKHRMDRTNHYFEMEILSAGSKGALAIGVAKHNYPLHVHPGWNPGAIGYHADDGKVFIERGQGDVFGPPCGEGDTMGCGVRYTVDCEGESESNSDSSDDDEMGSVEEIVEPREYLQQAMRGYRRGEGLHQMRAAYHNLRERSQQRQLQVVAAQRSISTSSCVVYFTKNGELIGEREVGLPKGGFYPIVAMLSQGEKLRVNWNPLTG